MKCTFTSLNANSKPCTSSIQVLATNKTEMLAQFILAEDTHISTQFCSKSSHCSVNLHIRHPFVAFTFSTDFKCISLYSRHIHDKRMWSLEKKSIHPKFREQLTSEKLHHITPLAYSSKKKVSKTGFLKSPPKIRRGANIHFTMKSENNPM